MPIAVQDKETREVVRVYAYGWEAKQLRLSNLVNIGPRLEEMLISSGVEDAEKLQELGAAKAAYQVKKNYPNSVIRLASLEGALRGTRWHNITDEEKAQLETEFNQLCSS